MILTSPGTEPFQISTSDWNAALDLVSSYGWDRTTKEADFGPTDSRKDAFRFGFGQYITAWDVKELAVAMREAASDENNDVMNDDVMLPLAELATFLEQCKVEIRLEQ